MSKKVLVLFREPERVPPYRDALLEAGIEPVLIPAGSPVSLDGLGGLLLTGGRDVDPALYGQTKQPETDDPDSELDRAEMSALGEALGRDLPVFGICRGLQLMNVHAGGTLIQHIVPPERHRQVIEGDKSAPVHAVEIAESSLLANVAGAARRWHVNSRHHQAVDQLGAGLAVSALDGRDGIVEAIERPGNRFYLAVQWHPEDQIRRDPAQLSLFQRFSAAVES